MKIAAFIVALIKQGKNYFVSNFPQLFPVKISEKQKNGEFIGIAKFSDAGSKKLTQELNEISKVSLNASFIEAIDNLIKKRMSMLMPDRLFCLFTQTHQQEASICTHRFTRRRSGCPRTLGNRYGCGALQRRNGRAR